MVLQRREDVQAQYRDAGNLTSRANLHQRFGTHERPWQEWAFDQLPSLDGARILDVGCGPAWLWRENLARLPADASIVACDLSCGMVSTARDALNGDRRFSFLSGDVQAIAFADETFDVVVANHMLYHAPDLDAALTEIKRVLRRDGSLLAATNGDGHMAELRHALLGVGPQYTKAFGLESGPPKVERHLAGVEVRRRSDVLRVTDPDAVVDYAASMAVKGDVDLDDLRRQVEAAIASDGEFPIHTEAGVICAMKA